MVIVHKKTIIILIVTYYRHYSLSLCNIQNTNPEMKMSINVDGMSHGQLDVTHTWNQLSVFIFNIPEIGMSVTISGVF